MPGRTWLSPRFRVWYTLSSRFPESLITEDDDNNPCDGTDDGRHFVGVDSKMEELAFLESPMLTRGGAEPAL